MISLAYTGTRAGMTIEQWKTFNRLVVDAMTDHLEVAWHDGDAIGGDAQAHATVATLKSRLPSPVITMHGHPCNKPDQRAFMDFDVLHEILPPITRNRVMVDAADRVFACPKQYEAPRRGSGTWATIHYAERKQVHLTIVWPDGTHVDEFPP